MVAKRLTVAVVCFMVLNLGVGLAQEKDKQEYEFFCKFKKGQKYVGKFETAADMGSKGKVGMEGEIAYEVKEIDKEEAKVTGEYKYLKVVIVLPMIGEIKFDSRKDEEDDNPMAKAMTEEFRKMVKSKLDIRMAKNGKITQAVSKEGPILITPIFPESKVKIGDKWENEIELDKKKKVKTESVFTKIEKIEGADCAVIHTRDKDNNVNYKTYFDIKEGRVLKTEGETKGKEGEVDTTVKFKVEMVYQK
jgi:hypothetical protein